LFKIQGVWPFMLNTNGHDITLHCIKPVNCVTCRMSWSDTLNLSRN